MAAILEVNRDLLPIGSSPLHLAANNNDTKTLTQLLHSYADVASNIDRLDGHGRTPLTVALQNGRMDVAVTLICFGANLKLLYESDKTISDVLTTEPFRPIIMKLLLLSECPYEALSVAHVTSLVHELAYLDGENAEMATILNNILKNISVGDARDHLGYTPLHYASIRGNLGIVLRLLEFSADPGVPSSSGSTSVHLACSKGHLEVVRNLQAHLLDPRSVLNAQDNLGRTPLHVALYCQQFSVVLYFLDELKPLLDLSVRDQQGHTPPTLLYTLRFSLGSSQVELLSAMALPCLSQEEATWMLHDCVSRGSVFGVLSALSNGCVVNTFDLMQQTPLLLACKLGHLEICKILVENGGDPNVHDAAMKTPMHYACELGHDTVMAFLLSLPELQIQLFYKTYPHPLSVEQLNLLVLYFKEKLSAQKPSCWPDWLALAVSNPAISAHALDSLVDEICPPNWVQNLLNFKLSKPVAASYPDRSSSYPLLSALVEIKKPSRRKQHRGPTSRPFVTQNETDQFVFESFKRTQRKKSKFKVCSGPRLILESCRHNKFRGLLHCALMYNNTEVFGYLLRKCLEQAPSCLHSLFVGEHTDVQEFLMALAKLFPAVEVTLNSLELTEYVKGVFHKRLKATEHSFQRDLLIHLMSDCKSSRFAGGLKNCLWRTRCDWLFKSFGRTGHVTFDSDEDKKQLVSILLDNCSLADLQSVSANSACPVDQLEPIFLATAVQYNCLWGAELLLTWRSPPLVSHIGRFLVAKAVKRCQVPMVDLLLQFGTNDFFCHYPSVDTLNPDLSLCQGLLVLASHGDSKTIIKLLDVLDLWQSESLWLSDHGPRLLYSLLMSASKDCIELGIQLMDSSASFLCRNLLRSVDNRSMIKLVNSLHLNLSVAYRAHKESLKCFMHFLTVCKRLKTCRLIFHCLCGMGMFEVVSFFVDHLTSADFSCLFELCDDSNRGTLYYAACSLEVEVIQLVHTLATGVTKEVTANHTPPLIGYLASVVRRQSHTLLSNHPKLRTALNFVNQLLPYNRYDSCTALSRDSQLEMLDCILPDPSQLKALLQTHGVYLILLIVFTLESVVTERVLAAIVPLLDSVDLFGVQEKVKVISTFVNRENLLESVITFALPLANQLSTRVLELLDSLLVKLFKRYDLIEFSVIKVYARKGFWGLCHEVMTNLKSSWLPNYHTCKNMLDVLDLVVACGKHETLRLLLVKSLDDSNQWLRVPIDSLFIIACKNHHTQVAMLLLSQDSCDLSLAISSVVAYGDKETVIQILTHIKQTQPQVLENHSLSGLRAVGRRNRIDLLESLVPLVQLTEAENQEDYQFEFFITILIEALKHGHFRLALLSLDALSSHPSERLAKDDRLHDILYWSCYWGTVDVLERLPFTSDRLLQRSSPEDLCPWECALFQGHVGKMSHMTTAPSLQEAYMEYVRVRDKNVKHSFFVNFLNGAFQFVMENTTPSKRDSVNCNLQLAHQESLFSCTKVRSGVFTRAVKLGFPHIVAKFLKHLGKYAGQFISLITKEWRFLAAVISACKLGHSEVLELLLQSLKEVQLLNEYLASYGNSLLSGAAQSMNASTLVVLLGTGEVVDFFPRYATARVNSFNSILSSAIRGRNPTIVEKLLNFFDEIDPGVWLDENIHGDCPLYEVFALGATDIIQKTLAMVSRSPKFDSISATSWVPQAQQARGWFHAMMLSNTRQLDKELSVTLSDTFSFDLRTLSLPNLIHAAVEHRHYAVVRATLMASGHSILGSEGVDPCTLFDPVVQEVISSCKPGCLSFNQLLSQCGSHRDILMKLSKTRHLENKLVAFLKYPGLSDPDSILDVFTSACSLGKSEVVCVLVSQRRCCGPVRTALDKEKVERGMALAVATGYYDIAAYLHSECDVSFKLHHLPAPENISEVIQLIFTCTSYYSLLDKLFQSVSAFGYQLPLAGCWLAHNWTEQESVYLIKQLGATSYAPSNPWSFNLPMENGLSRTLTISIDWDSFSESLLHTPVCQAALRKQQYTPLLVEAIVFSPAVLGQVLGFAGSDKTFQPSCFLDLGQTSLLVITCTTASGLASFRWYGDQATLTLLYLAGEGAFQFPAQEPTVPHGDSTKSPIQDSGILSSLGSSVTDQESSGKLEELVDHFIPLFQRVLWKGAQVSLDVDRYLFSGKHSAQCSCISYTLKDCVNAIKLVQEPSFLYAGISSGAAHSPRVRSISSKCPLLRKVDVHLLSSRDEQSKPVSVTRHAEVIKLCVVVLPCNKTTDNSLEQVTLDQTLDQTLDRTSNEAEDNLPYNILLTELRQCFLEAEADVLKANLKEIITKTIIPRLRHSLKTGPLDSEFVSLAFQNENGLLLRMDELDYLQLADLFSLLKAARFVSLFSKLLQVFWSRPKGLKNLFQSTFKIVLSKSKGTSFVDRGGHSLLTLSAADLLARSLKDNMFTVFELIDYTASKTNRTRSSIERFAPGIPAPFGCYFDLKRSPGFLFPLKDTCGTITVQLVNYRQEVILSPPTSDCVLSVQMKSPSSEVMFASSSTDPHPHTASRHLLINSAPDGVFEIKWTPLHVGFYYISVRLNEVPIHASPLKAFSSDTGTPGSWLAMAGKPLSFVATHSTSSHVCQGSDVHLPFVSPSRQLIKPLCIKALKSFLEAEKKNTDDCQVSDTSNERAWLLSHVVGTASGEPTHSKGELLNPPTPSALARSSPLTHHISICSKHGGQSKWFSVAAGNVVVHISPYFSLRSTKEKEGKQWSDYFKVKSLPLLNDMSRVTIECTKACPFMVFASCSTCQAGLTGFWLGGFSQEPVKCYVCSGPICAQSSSVRYVSKSQRSPKKTHTLIAGSELKLIFKAIDKFGNVHTSGGGLQSAIICKAAQHEFQPDISVSNIRQMIARGSTDVPCLVQDTGSGTCTIAGNVYTSGLHEVKLTGPLHFTVCSVRVINGPPYAPNCRLLASNMYEAATSQEYTCLLALFDMYMNECTDRTYFREVTAHLVPTSDQSCRLVPSIPNRSRNLNDNVVQLGFVPYRHGNFQLNVEVRGHPVPLCPVAFVVIKVSETFTTRLAKLKRFITSRFGLSCTPTFTVDRSDILESSLQVFAVHPEYFERHLRVRFGEEVGIDAGGVSKEFFHMLCLNLVDPQYALFQSVNGFYKPCHSSSINDNHLMYFQFFGKILAKAIIDDHLIPVRFTPSVHKYLLGQECTVDDLKIEDPTLHMSLLAIANSETEEALEELAVNFTAMQAHFGSLLTVELEEGGTMKMVTMDNRKEFVQKLYEWHLIGCINQQLSSMKQGFNTLLPNEQVSDISSHELEVILCGQSTIDISFIKQQTSYNGYTAASNVVLWLWEVLQAMSQEELSQFLQFSTGSACLPSVGVGQWCLKVQRGSSDSSLLPSASTCFNTITLPQYRSKENLRWKLTVAISYGRQAFLMH